MLVYKSGAIYCQKKDGSPSTVIGMTVVSEIVTVFFFAVVNRVLMYICHDGILLNTVVE